MIHSDMRSVMQIASSVVSSKPSRRIMSGISAAVRSPSPRRSSLPRLTATVRAFSTNETGADLSHAEKVADKPPVCTADELHYVSVANSDWRLALWRYNPPPQAPRRNHPLLLLSGVGTNAIGYDLSPGCSFARYMCAQGFDTWILEVRGAGLSMQRSDLRGIEQSAHAISDQIEYAADTATDGPFDVGEQKTNTSRALEESDISVIKDLEGIERVYDNSVLVKKLTETLLRLSEGVSGFLSEGQVKIMSATFFDQMSRLLEDSFLFERFIEIRKKLSSLLEKRQNSVVASQIMDLSQKLVNIFEESQRSVSPQISNLQERVNTTLEDFQKQLDLIVMYDWDFDHYLLEDLPAAMEYIRALANPSDGKLLAVGHSMGGILLYAMLSRCAFEGKDPGLAAIVTLASSLDYRSSESSLKQILPLADPAQALNVPIVPLGALLAAAYPLSSRPPYVLSWLNDLISSEDMMHPEQLRKLVMNNFCTVPAKLIFQLRTAFMEGGLSDRSGSFFYKDYLYRSEIPVLAIAGDRDIICPPKAVYETAKLFPEHLVTYKICGEPEGPHYAHYDLVGGRLAVDHVYPCIIQFLTRYD